VDLTNDDNPQAILSGDSNFELGGVPVKSGLVSFSTNDPVAWGADRHIRTGNIGLGDGSVESVSSSGLLQCWVNCGSVTNRLAVP